jgi:hypothetical protein
MLSVIVIYTFVAYYALKLITYFRQKTKDRQ